MTPIRSIALSVALAVLSLLVWVLVIAAGEQDPTDNPYWYLSLFTLTVVASFLVPGRPWRWAAAVILPQFLGPFYPIPSNIWPLSVVFLGFLFLALLLAAYCSALLRKIAGNLFKQLQYESK
jgi:hypothetical protein